MVMRSVGNRVAVGLAIIALSVMAVSAPADACGETAQQHGDPSDHDDGSWVRSDAMIYGASRTSGIFRFRVNSPEVEVIAAHDRRSPDAIEISPDKTILYYRFATGMFDATHWLFDLKAGREIDLRTIAKDLGAQRLLRVSPDFAKIAWVPRRGDGVSVADLSGEHLRFHPLQPDQRDGTAVLFGLTWSDDGRDILVARRHAGSEDFWSVDAATGVWRKIRGEWTPGRPDVPVRLLRDDMEIGSFCVSCLIFPGVSSLTLSDGTAVKLISDDFMIEKQGAPPIKFASATPTPTGSMETMADGTIVVTTAPMCIFPRKLLIGEVDDRYVIYAHDDGIWLYGVEENKNTRLLDDTDSLLTW